MTMRERRQRWWSLTLEPEFKKRQIARVLAFTAAYVAISTACVSAVYSLAMRPLTQGQLPFYIRSEMLREAGGAPGLQETLVVWATLMIGLSSFFAIVVGLYFSHKLAGPIYRFKLELQRLADGQPTRTIRLRQGDDFQDVAQAMNRALERLQGDEMALLERLETAEQRFAETRRAVRDHLEDPQKLRQILTKIESGDGSR